jgi:hypothetical protein
MLAALGAAGVGFGLYIYAVPWKAAQNELKRRTGELRSARNEALARGKELQQLERELEEIRSSTSTTAEGRRRTELRVIRAAIENRLRGSKAVLSSTAHVLHLRFPEDELFDARGPALSRDGQGRLQALAELLTNRTVAVRVSAPMGGGLPPKWARGEFPSGADFSTARARAGLRAMLRAGLDSAVGFAVVGGGGPTGEEGSPSLDIEIEPKG